ncbi:hypothetical protein DYB25_006494 [Aphanomyces astaci]|uniref:Protein kinase domain-containing protein n=1 Tax=Aphanomyces astaci TaxID=112090 RepID=A0A397BE71_APHAT|nr:hypothetical protein DYB25_006494 [Aphanomyces astaci]
MFRRVLASHAHHRPAALLTCAAGFAALYVADGPVVQADSSASGSMLIQQPLETRYGVQKTIGRGGFAHVVAGWEKGSNAPVAIKRVSKTLTSKAKFVHEVSILQQLQGTNHVVQLKDAFEAPDDWILVTEYVPGGELFDRLVQHGTFSEQHAKSIARDLAETLITLHAQRLVHGDVKPENILLDSANDDSARMILIDFGLSFRASEGGCHSWDGSGTVAYAAPEVLNQSANVTSAIDMWALGVVLFVVLAGYHPFDVASELSDAAVRLAILQGDFDFNHAASWAHISDDAKDLIRRLIVVDPAARLTAEQVLAHPWLKESPSPSISPIRKQDDTLLYAKKRALPMPRPPRKVLSTNPFHNESDAETGSPRETTPLHPHNAADPLDWRTFCSDKATDLLLHPPTTTPPRQFKLQRIVLAWVETVLALHVIAIDDPVTASTGHVLSSLGLYYYGIGQWWAAAASLEPALAYCHHQTWHASYDRFNLTRAHDLYATIVPATPHDPYVLHDYAIVLLERAEYKAGLDVLAHVLAVFPQFQLASTAMLWVAVVLLHLGRGDESVAYFGCLLDTPPSPFTATDMTVLCAVGYGRSHNTALAACQGVSRTKLTKADMLADLAKRATSLGHYLMAYVVYFYALHRFKTSKADTWFCFADTLRHLGRADEALQALAVAAQLDPAHSLVQTALGSWPHLPRDAFLHELHHTIDLEFVRHLKHSNL